MERNKIEKHIADAMIASLGVGWADVKHEGRRVTIWPILEPDDLFNLQLIDSTYDLNRVVGGGYVGKLTRRAVIRTCLVFLFGKLIEDDDRIFEERINQGERRCFVLGETVTPTRLKICYDLPASGPRVAWRHHVSFIKPRTETTVAPVTGILHNSATIDVRYLAKLGR